MVATAQSSFLSERRKRKTGQTHPDTAHHDMLQPLTTRQPLNGCRITQSSVTWLRNQPDTVFDAGNQPVENQPQFGREIRSLLLLELYDELDSGFPDELRLQLHRSESVDPAIDIVIAIDKPDVLDLRTSLDSR